MRKTTLNTRKITRLVCLVLLWQLLIIGNICSNQALQQETPRPRVSKPTKVDAKESSPIDESDGSLSQTKDSKDSKHSKDTQDPKNPNNNQDISDDTGTIKIGVDYIQVAFSVVDEKNRLVTDLNPSEVKLYDNGQSQEPEFFQRSNNLPMMLAILIDTSASQQFLLPDEKNAVSTFFDTFFREGKDYGSVLSFNGETSLAIGLTSNLSRLKSALQRVKKDEIFRDDEGGVSSLSTALYDAIYITAIEILDGKTARRITSRGRTTSQNNSGRLAIRRAIFVLTDGVDNSSETRVSQAIRTAQRLGINVYALGIGDRFRFGNVDQQLLDRICQQTGGRAFYPKNESDLRENFRRIATELSSQYILAYYPTGTDVTGDFRTIEIKIPSRPEWRVIHQQGTVPTKNQ